MQKLRKLPRNNPKDRSLKAAQLPKGWASKPVPGHNQHIPGTTNYLRSRTFQSWFNMWVRCTYSSHPQFHNYGGRGITVDPRWLSFDTFLTDMGHRPKHLSLDRIDTDGGYSSSNCRWADSKTQARNRRNVKIRKAA